MITDASLKLEVVSVRRLRRAVCGFVLLAVSMVLLTISGGLIVQAVTEREVRCYTQTWYEVDVGELHVKIRKDALIIFLRSFVVGIYHVRLRIHWAEGWRTLAYMPLYRNETLSITLTVAEIWHLFGYDKPMPICGYMLLKVSYYLIEPTGHGYYTTDIGWVERGEMYLHGHQAILRGEAMKIEETVMRVRHLELLWVAIPVCFTSILAVFTALRFLATSSREEAGGGGSGQ